MDEKTLTELKQEVRDLMPQYGTHGFEHVERVYAICQHIGIVENADLDILFPAALLHDIARKEEDHAQVGAAKAKLILYRYGQPEEAIEKITAAIATHSFSGKKPPKTLEAKILSDADKLEALGAIGIYRTAVYSGEYSRPIEDFIAHFKEKLLNLEVLLFTDEAKRMAAERTRYMIDFLSQLEKELTQKG